MNVHSAHNDKPDINIHCLYPIKVIISDITVNSVNGNNTQHVYCNNTRNKCALCTQ